MSTGTGTWVICRLPLCKLTHFLPPWGAAGGVAAVKSTPSSCYRLTLLPPSGAAGGVAAVNSTVMLPAKKGERAARGSPTLAP